MKTQKLIKHYTDYVLKHDKRPTSIYNFCEHLKIKETQFYEYFSSFDQLEADILSKIVDNAVSLTKDGIEGEEGLKDSKNQLLTFYLTLTEVLKSNRSLVLFIIPHQKMELKAIKTLLKSKHSFLNFLDTLDLPLSFISFIPDVKIKEKAINNAAWLQFISILKYWLHDNSPGFEKTDIFIEKSLKLSFELSDSNVLNSIVDLGKFMINKK